ncbi:MAG: N-acetyltransferase [Rhodospirillaceae bacterium]|nr:N-acetyltransferase [Rhodospirillaceae bacterium]
MPSAGAGIDLRESLPADLATLERLYPAAFPAEDLLPLVKGLLAGRGDVLSLVAVHDQALVGHVAFTLCHLAGRREKIALLAPLAIAPAWQKRGIGSVLVRAGLRRLKDTDVAMVLVLGDPAYYGRFGFRPGHGILPPYRLPAEWHTAWQALDLRERGADLQGELVVPEPWQRPALWAQ